MGIIRTGGMRWDVFIFVMDVGRKHQHQGVNMTFLNPFSGFNGQMKTVFRLPVHKLALIKWQKKQVNQELLHHFRTT
jgi:hypothetical protein